IFYDQRGGGKSTLPADTGTLVVERQVQDLDELRQHFKLSTVTLVAHSYGPLLAASYALAHPSNVTRMVFFGPVPPRRADFWQRCGDRVGHRRDAGQRSAQAAAARTMTTPSSPDAAVRQACRAYWAIGLRPRLAAPDHTVPLIKSALCATAPAGIR